MYEIGSYQDKGVKVTMVMKDDRYLTYLYIQATKRLMKGIATDPDLYLAELKSAYPKRVQEVIDNLMANYTAEGIENFETSFRRGFKRIGRWEG